jgi:lipopolysaccharide export system permease protein
MRGITIYQSNPGGPPTTILARSGFLTYTADGRDAVLELKDGEIHEIPAEDGGSRHYRRMVFKTHIIHIAGAGGALERTVRDSRSDREMSAAELQLERNRMLQQYDASLATRRGRLEAEGLPKAALDALAPDRLPVRARLAQWWDAVRGRSPDLDALAKDRPLLKTDIDLWQMEREALRRRIAGLSVEIHKKYSLPAACVVFVLIGAPLGMRVRRAGPAVAFVSVAFFLFYYLCLVGGEELAHRLLVPPWLAMWLPNLVLGFWGLDWTLAACELRPRRRPRPRAAAASA